MSTDAFDWDTEHPLGGPGWYAVVVVYDESEGLFPTSAFWTGSSWQGNQPVRAHHGPHADKTTALAWAREHDPEL